MPRFKTLLFGALTATLVLLAPASSEAQETGERYHFFRSQGISSPAKQKELTELLRGFDPEMVVSLDEPTQMLKLLTTVHLDIAEVRNLCALIGVQLQPVGRRESALVNE